MIKRYLFGAFMVGVVCLVYNYFVFSIFNFYPDLVFDFRIFDSELDFYLISFLKNFLVALILMILFNIAYKNITSDKDSLKNLFIGIFFFVLYGVFALTAFAFADMALMKTQEGMLLLLTVDGFVESFIATMPIRLFHK